MLFTLWDYWSNILSFLEHLSYTLSPLTSSVHADLLALRRAAIFTLNPPAVVVRSLFLLFPPLRFEVAASQSLIHHLPLVSPGLPGASERSRAWISPAAPLDPAHSHHLLRKKSEKKSKPSRSRIEEERLKSIPSGGAGSLRGTLRSRCYSWPRATKRESESNKPRVFREEEEEPVELAALNRKPGPMRGHRALEVPLARPPRGSPGSPRRQAGPPPEDARPAAGASTRTSGRTGTGSVCCAPGTAPTRGTPR